MAGQKQGKPKMGYPGLKPAVHGKTQYQRWSCDERPSQDIPQFGDSGIIVWMDENHFAPLSNRGKPLFVSIYRGIIIPGILRWYIIVFPSTVCLHHKQTRFEVDD